MMNLMSRTYSGNASAARLVEFLRRNGHSVVLRQTKYGNLRYSVDGGRDLTAYALSHIYGDQSERKFGKWGETEDPGAYQAGIHW